ncbi:MAG: hypothetical protein K8M05_39415 [Deltaproteobacteria bacterium]|nr:hypothetical protein [Kofleriaceae bacterium]
MRTFVIASLVACLAAATSSSARADCYDSDCRDARARAWERPRFEGAFGLLAGGYSVGSVGGAAIGMHLDGGLRAGKLALLGEYDFLSHGQSAYEYEAPIRGVMHRLGANLRYSIAAFGGRDVPIRGDFWLEGGVGNQLVQWHGGGELSRRDLAFGAGGQMTVRVGRDKPSFIGFYYAFRGLVARDPAKNDDAPPTCAGPCDMATGPSPWDMGAFFNFGVVFSR